MSLSVPMLTDEVRGAADAALTILQDRSSDTYAYRMAMTELGHLLGDVLAEQAFEAGDHVCLAMTVEDADYLGQGMLRSLEQAGHRVSLACFWNDRSSAFGLRWAKMAPVVQEYVEPLDGVDHIVMLKSIISGSCVVRTNLLHLFDEIVPGRVHVAAPVMLDGADARLAEAFPAEIAERFQYWTFEVDTDRTEDGEVLPGIGGEVYGRLGLGDAATKNRIMPELLMQRSLATA